MLLTSPSRLLRHLLTRTKGKIIHCDIKPENFILFPGNQVKLADFGFAKISLRTLKASGSGTIDYIAPEQAMGRPKFQSDVFSLGLVLYRLLSGKLPEWPFKWPMIGYDRLQSRVPAELIAMLRKSIELDPADRYRNAVEMYAVFRKVKRLQERRQKKAAPRKEEVIEKRGVVASYAVARVPEALQGRVGYAASLQELRGAGRRKHAGLPVVWYGTSDEAF